MKYALALVLLFLLTSCDVSATAVTPATLISPTSPATHHFYAIELDEGQQTLIEIERESGAKQPIFQIPVSGWLASFDLFFAEANGGQFVLAYAPPPPAGEINFGFTSLYLMNQDGSSMDLLLASTEDQEFFFNPTWSADGQSIYFSHVLPLDKEAYTFSTTLERLHLPTGQIDLIAEESIWPQISPDGTMLAYVHIESGTLANALILAESDGANARELVDGDLFTAVDAPVFSPDSQMIYFSAAEPAVARLWWEKVFGVQVAAAHNLPSDWYRVSVTGGTPERLTEIDGVGLYGRFVLSGLPLFAFASQEGLYEMTGDGTNVTKWLEGTFTDSLAWAP